MQVLLGLTGTYLPTLTLVNIFTGDMMNLYLKTKPDGKQFLAIDTTMSIAPEGLKYGAELVMKPYRRELSEEILEKFYRSFKKE